MSIINAEQIQRAYKNACGDKRNGEIALTFVHHKKSFAWVDKQTLQSQMKIWRNLAKEGKVKIAEYNNKTKNIEKDTWYCFVVQPFKPNGDMNECNFDPFGLFVLGEMVSGYIYAFKTEGNRDAIYNYVMKGIAQPVPREDKEGIDDACYDTEEK